MPRATPCWRKGSRARGMGSAQARCPGRECAWWASPSWKRRSARASSHLAQSFAITAALIFLVFLFVFRSATARLLAMIPSLFAILATFLGMRLFGASLNLATILIATTILGTTENDQIHFFHHLNEREDAPLAEALEHALRVSGQAIIFATLINAAGFLALSFSTFPPLRQFGLVTGAAFVLALIADFTALPAGLWMVDRRRERQARPPKAARLYKL